MKNDILKNFTYGMYAIGVKDGDKASACIINSVSQISSGAKNNLIININRNSYSTECIKKNGIFSVSVLSKDTSATAIGALGLVSGRNVDKLINLKHKVLVEGIPVIKENTCCWVLCKVLQTFDFENQSMVIGQIIAGSDITVGEPMTYSYYINELQGISPIDSPIYIQEREITDNHISESFHCSVCGYIYNDANFGFEELGDDWVCPVCNMPKVAFVRQ